MVQTPAMFGIQSLVRGLWWAELQTWDELSRLRWNEQIWDEWDELSRLKWNGQIWDEWDELFCMAVLHMACAKFCQEKF